MDIRASLTKLGLVPKTIYHNVNNINKIS